MGDERKSFWTAVCGNEGEMPFLVAVLVCGLLLGALLFLMGPLDNLSWTCLESRHHLDMQCQSPMAYQSI